MYVSAELASILDRLYGGVCYVGIDTDPELRYPKGAGRMAFSSQQSYIDAISARFVQLKQGEIDKRVSVCAKAKPPSDTPAPTPIPSNGAPSAPLSAHVCSSGTFGCCALYGNNLVEV